MSIGKWYWEMTVMQRLVVWVCSLAFCVFMGMTLCMYTDGTRPEPKEIGIYFGFALAMPVLGSLVYAHLGKKKYLGR